MPARSKAQRKLFGIAHAVQQGKIPASKVSDPAKNIAKTVKKKEVKKFASTPDKGLPDRVKKEMKEAIRELVGEILSETPTSSIKFPQARKKSCPNCRGTGKRIGDRVDAFKQKKCSTCNGTGKVGEKSVKESQLARLQEKLGRELSVPEKHQLAIAYKTVKMPDAMVGVMGGMTVQQAKDVIERLTGKEYKERKTESVNEYEGPHPSDVANYWIKCPKCKYRTGINSGDFDSPPPHDKILCPKCKTPMKPEDLTYAKKYGWNESVNDMYRRGTMSEKVSLTTNSKVCNICKKPIDTKWKPGQLEDPNYCKGHSRQEVDRYKKQHASVTKESTNEGITYVAIYNGKEISINNATSLYDAKKKAIERFKPAKSKEHMISVMPAEKDGDPIKHVATEAAAVDKELSREMEGEKIARSMEKQHATPEAIVNKLKSMGFDKDHALNIFYRVHDVKESVDEAKEKFHCPKCHKPVTPDSNGLHKCSCGWKETEPKDDVQVDEKFKIDRGVPVKEQYKINQDLPWLQKLVQKHTYHVGPVTVMLAFLPKRSVLGINAVAVVNPSHPEQDAPRHIEAALDGITGLKDTVFKLDQIAPHKEKKTGSSLQKLWLLPADKISKSGGQQGMNETVINETASFSADKLMRIDYTIWDKLHIQSGGDLYDNKSKWEQYKKVLAQVVKGMSPVNQSTLLALENENHHALMKALGELGLIDPKAPYYKSLTRKEGIEESAASDEAKRKGLEYLSFGRYGKKGKQTHMVKNGHLVPITSGGKTASGKDVAKSEKKPESRKEKNVWNQSKWDDIQNTGTAKDEREYLLKYFKDEPKIDKYGKENDPDNWWRDAFHSRHGRISKEEMAKMVRIHPDLAKAFKGLYGDYIKKDKNGNYEWPEMIDLGV